VISAQTRSAFVARDHARMLRCLAATAPRLHVRDDRDTPLFGRGGMRGKMRLICPTRQAEYFSRDDWTSGITLNARTKFDFWRSRFGDQSGPSAQSDRTAQAAICPTGRPQTA